MFLVVALAYIIFWGPLFTVSFCNTSIDVKILILILISNLLGTTVDCEFLSFYTSIDVKILILILISNLRGTTVHSEFLWA